MSVVTIECPSGLTIDVRGLEVSECNVLADRQQVQAGSLFDTVLSQCTVRLAAPGPYRFADKVDWNEVHVGDRLFAILRIRMATYQKPYAFRVNCSECREPFEWTLDLADLPVQPLPSEARDAMRGDRVLTARWEAMEREVRFRLLVGSDTAKTRRIAKQRPKELALVSLLARVVSVESVSDVELSKFLSHLGAESMLDLIATMDERDGGVDTEIEVVCQECGATQAIELPFGRSFWLPKTKKAPAAG